MGRIGDFRELRPSFPRFSPAGVQGGPIAAGDTAQPSHERERLVALS